MSSNTEHSASSEAPAVTMMEAPLYLQYNFIAGASASPFLHAIKKGELLGRRCPSCENVYIPCRGCCSRCGVATNENVVLSDHGVVDKFTIVHLPIPNNPMKPPLAIAHVLLDGADTSFTHLIGEIDNADVHVGMRVKAVWKPEQEWDYSLENIRYFIPEDSQHSSNQEEA